MMDEQLKNIIEKVSILYMRYGIRSVTMDDVARHLGVSKKTIYTHVKDKQELVELVVQNQFENHLKIEKELIDKGENALDELLVVYLHVSEMVKNMNPSYKYDLRKYYPHLCEKFTSYNRDHIINTITQNLKKGKEEGIYRSDIKEEIIAKMHAARHFSLVESGDEDLEFLMENDTFKEIFFYHIHAVINDKGRELLAQKNLFD